MISVNNKCCQRVANFVQDHGKEGAIVTAAAAATTMACGPMIAGLGSMVYTGYRIYKKITQPQPFDAHRKSQLFRRLPQEDFNKIVEKIGSLPKLDEGEIEALLHGNINHPLFKEVHWTDKAMKAYLENQIDSSTLHRLMIFAACEKECGSVTSIKVFEGNGIEILKEAMDCRVQSDDDQKETAASINESFLTEQQWNQVLEKLKTKPDKAQFFLIPYPYTESTLWNALENIKRGFDRSRMLLVRTESGPKIAILPPDLLTEIWKAKYGGENVPTPLNIFGQRSTECLSKNTRPIRIPCHPYLDCPEFIHGRVPATDLAFYLHDIVYHLPIEASMGKLHRNLWIQIAQWIKPESSIAFERLIDKDMNAYSKGSSSSMKKEEIFWFALNNSSMLHTELATWVCLYVFYNPDKCIGINFDQFRDCYLRLGRSGRLEQVKKAIETIERFPGIAKSDYEKISKSH
jgi:hypothetical protein